MPHITIKLLPGRPEGLKVRLADQIVRDVASALGCGDDTVSLAIEEVGLEDWTQKVYNPEIRDNPNLYKRPGYDPME